MKIFNHRLCGRRQMKRASISLAVLLLLFITTACGERVVTVQQPGLTISRPAVTTPEDRGDFNVLYISPQQPTHQQFENQLRSSRIFELTATSLNAELILPFDLSIALKECGVINAFYDPNTKTISICYELLAELLKIFSTLNLPLEELTAAFNGAVNFFFRHEIGHALVDAYQLAITGREEDAVDQFSVFIAINLEEEQGLLLSSQHFFISGAQQTNIESLPFWDEHSLDMQRYFNTLCWVYGSNPQRFASLVGTGQNQLPEARAVRCLSEYQLLSESWTILLKPFLKQP